MAEVGIGLVAATLGARAALDRHPARARHGVLLLGTCGGYPASPALVMGDVVAAGRLRLADAAVAEGRGAMIAGSAPDLEADAALAAALVAAGARSGGVATTLSVTTDDALAAAFARATGCIAEHLEAYAVAAACAAAGVPFAAALGVANDVGGRGRDQWRAHHLEAAARACDVALAVLSRSRTTAPSPA